MVYHVLKDGSMTDNIGGHVVKIEDAESLYELINEISYTKKRCSIKRLEAYFDE